MLTKDACNLGVRVKSRLVNRERERERRRERERKKHRALVWVTSPGTLHHSSAASMLSDHLQAYAAGKVLVVMQMKRSSRFWDWVMTNLLLMIVALYVSILLVNLNKMFKCANDEICKANYEDNNETRK